jgi:CheY-like chemotaxis protein
VIAVEEEEQALAALAEVAIAGDSTSDIDVIVLDVPLPEAQEAARAILSATESTGRHRPTVIALASPTDPRPVREAAHASGIDYVLLRPCPAAELAKHLRRLHLPRSLREAQRR